MRTLSQLPRVALVIRVQEYSEACYQNLGTDHNVVESMVDMLERKGNFVVAACRDPTKRTIIKALSKLKGDIKQHDKDGGCVALLYYSGLGMMDDMSNHYLLPTDWEEVDDISTSLVHFACKLEGRTGVLAHLTGAKAAVALFDCCGSFAHQGQARDGLAESKGGWQGPIATQGTSEHSLLLCYACSPGAQAHEGHEHGHFTKAVLENLCTDQSVSDAIDTINDQVKRSTKLRPHVQHCIMRPFKQIRLGLSETSSATNMEAAHSPVSVRSSSESQHLTTTSGRSDGTGHQLHRQSKNVQELTDWARALLNEKTWRREGASMAIAAALIIVAGFLAYSYVVVGMALTISMAGATVGAVLRKHDIDMTSVAMAAVGVAAGCLACRLYLLCVSMSLALIWLVSAWGNFVGSPDTTQVTCFFFGLAAAAAVPAGCILDFPGSDGLAVGFIIATGQACVLLQELHANRGSVEGVDEVTWT